VVVDGLSVTKTINSVQDILDKENLSDPVKSSIKDLILVASIMKDRLNTNSKNSSSPPSKDDLKDKDQKDKSDSGSRKPGGQKDHNGSQLQSVENPDEIINIAVDQSQLPRGEYSPSGYESRQVIDLKISRHVIEYRAEIVRNDIGQEYRADFPGEVTRPVQYGANLKAHAIYMSQFQLIPYDLVTQQINDNTEINLSTGSVYNFNAEVYRLLLPFKSWLIASQSNSALLHADETGINIGGNNHWLHSL